MLNANPCTDYMLHSIQYPYNKGSLSVRFWNYFLIKLFPCVSAKARLTTLTPLRDPVKTIDLYTSIIISDISDYKIIH